MPRSDVTIRFIEGAEVKVYPLGAQIAAGASAVSASDVVGNDIAVEVAGAAIVAAAGSTAQNQWLGEGLSGEFGAIAENDNTGTIYSYQRKYAPDITLPYPTGDVTGISTSQVNPNASDEYLVFDRAGWDALDANGDKTFDSSIYKKVFIAKGVDLYTAWAAIDNITNGGTASEPRWFIYWDNTLSGAASTADPRPWDQAERVQMPFETYLDGVAYIYFVGLTCGIYGSRSQRSYRFQNGTNNCLVYRCLQEYTGIDGAGQGSNGTPLVIGPDGADPSNITVFESVFRKAYKYGDEQDDITVYRGSGHRIISCEFSDPNNASIQVPPNNSVTDLIIEDCEISRDTYYDVNGNEDANGGYQQGDSGIGFKGSLLSGSAVNIGLYGNLFYGFRPTSPGVQNINVPGKDNDPGSGPPIVTSDAGDIKRIDIQNNVFFDTHLGFISFNTGSSGSPSSNHTIANNVFHDHSTRPVALHIDLDQVEMYHNTFSSLYGIPSNQVVFNFWTGDPYVVSNLDMLGNFIQDCEGWSIVDSRISGWAIGYNGYAGTYTQKNYTHSSVTDYEAPSKAALNMGDFKFYRKKLTDPPSEKVFDENDPNLITISGVVPTSNTPSAFLTGTASANIGSRPGIGVDDDVY